MKLTKIYPVGTPGVGSMSLTEVAYNAIISHKKVSKVPNEFEDLFKQFCRNVDALNVLGRYETMYNGIRLDEIEIADVFRPLIAPSSVTLSGGRDEEDLLVKIQVEGDNFKWTKSQFSNFAAMVNGILKKDGVSPITDFRKDVCLTAANAKNFYHGADDLAAMHNEADWNVYPFELEWTPFNVRFLNVDPGEVADWVLTHLFD